VFWPYRLPEKEQNMGFIRFMLGLYRWEALSDGSLLEMKQRVENGIITASELACGSGFVARSSRKDLEKLLESKAKIDVEVARRGLTSP